MVGRVAWEGTAVVGLVARRARRAHLTAKMVQGEVDVVATPAAAVQGAMRVREVKVGMSFCLHRRVRCSTLRRRTSKADRPEPRVSADAQDGQGAAARADLGMAGAALDRTGQTAFNRLLHREVLWVRLELGDVNSCSRGISFSRKVGCPLGLPSPLSALGAEL